LARSAAPLTDRAAALRDVLRLAPGNMAAKAELDNLNRQEQGGAPPDPLWFSFST
jgi:hypothetical protein